MLAWMPVGSDLEERRLLPAEQRDAMELGEDMIAKITKELDTNN